MHKSGWQEGEQGVIETAVECLLPHIPESEWWAVEFGAGNGTKMPVTCDRILRLPGWRSLLIEPNRIDYIALTKHVPETSVVVNDSVLPTGEGRIDVQMRKRGCPADPFVMIVDVDSIEYHIVKDMESRPHILCVETLDLESPKHKQTEGAYVPEIAECGTFLDDEFGTQLQANAAAFDELLTPRGYALLFRTRYNSVYVRAEHLQHLRRKKLNLGCGPRNLPGYEGIDIRIDGTDVRKLPHDSNSVDEVYSSHLLEHFPYEERDSVLAEWVRVLKPDGVLRIAVPDMKKLAREFLKEQPDDGPDYIEQVLYGGHNDSNDHHRAAFTENTLRSAMYRAGVGFITPFEAFIPGDCANNKYSLNLEGVKRWWPRIEKPKIVLCLSQPRFTFTGHEKSLLELARKLDIEIVPSCGAFWDRDMTIATQYAISKFNPDFLLYSDYDSVFEVDDVRTLIETIQNDPTMAAIGSVQMSRHNDAPLVMEANIDYSADVTRVRFQHFGLTVIRREVFDELPQPWFWSVPGKAADGTWDWNAYSRSDADITFWRNLDMYGFRVYQHNKVCIGHIVQTVKYPKDSGRGVQLVPIETYWKKGKPESAKFVQDLYRTKPAGS